MPRQRLPLVIAGAVLLGFGATPAVAAPSREELHLEGVAGGQTVLTFPRGVELDRVPQDLIGFRGEFGGFVLTQIGGASPSWYARQRMSRDFACAGVQKCHYFLEDTVTSSDQRPTSGPIDRPSASVGGVRPHSSPLPPPVRLPAGRYALTLIGQPGARVTAKLSAIGLGRVRKVKVNRGSALIVRPLQPATAGVGTWTVADTHLDSRRTFVGLLVGVGFGDVRKIDYDACLSPDPLPAVADCSGDGEWFSSNPGDTGDSGLGDQSFLALDNPAGRRVFARATFTQMGSGGALRAASYVVGIPS